MTNIERCKKAQELGLRVQFKSAVENLGKPWQTNGMPWAFGSAPEFYRIHPDDEKAFENFLALETSLANRAKTINCLIGKHDQWAKAHSRVSEEAIALRIENERLKNAANKQIDAHTLAHNAVLAEAALQKGAELLRMKDLHKTQAESIGQLLAERDELLTERDGLRKQHTTQRENYESRLTNLQANYAAVVAEKERLSKTAPAATSDDLVLQLRRKLGPLDTITIVTHGA